MHSVSPPSVCVITSGEVSEANFRVQRDRVLELARAAGAAGADLFQVREKNLPASLLTVLVEDVVRLSSQSSMKVTVNDRADVAAVSGAAGVHLTSRSIDAAEVRRAFGARFLIGFSAHTLEEVSRAREQGCDYVFFSPIFETPSKAGYGPPQGLDALKRAVEAAAGMPVFALGGIDEHNVASALSTGASGVAAIRMFSDATAVADVVAKIKSLRTE